MATSIRPGEAAGLGRLREETYVCELGVGRLLLAGDLPLALELPRADVAAPAGHSTANHWTAALERYFAGERVAFELDVAAHAAARGLTDFERDVYEALARVPFGEAVSYRDLAREPAADAYRAVGSAMARNALPVILPCHRVIKNDGRLGFYGEDPAWKERCWRSRVCAWKKGRVR